ncbi:MAG: branched-chain amino acid transport system substrate-binding protein [Chloroflexia bacterium]|nr:branched-chain amino acid transport system substrate-binding protein [Chloroflexia bacterium]
MAAPLAAFLLSSCTAETTTQLPPSSGQTLRIVSSLPYKGPDAEQSNLTRDAIDLAIDERRALLPGWNIEHVALDGGDSETGEPSTEVEADNARGAAHDPSVVAYIGPYASGAAMVSMPVLNEAGLLQVLPVATWPGLTQEGWASGEPGRYYPAGTRTMLRLMPPDSAQAQVAARKAKQIGARSVLILADSSDYGRGMASAFRTEAGRLGISLVGTADPDTASRLDAALVAKADVVFLAISNLTSAATAANMLAEHPTRLGVISTDVLLSDRLSHELLEGIEGWYVVFNGDTTPGDPGHFADFAAAFESRYGLLPSQYAANAYDATAAVLDAAAHGSVDRKSILDGVRAGTYEGGVSGKLSFHPNGDIQGGALTLFRVQGGEFKVQEEIVVP